MNYVIYYLYINWPKTEIPCEQDILFKFRRYCQIYMYYGAMKSDVM